MKTMEKTQRDRLLEVMKLHRLNANKWQSLTELKCDRKVSEGTIRALTREENPTTPTGDTISRLAKAINVPSTYLSPDYVGPAYGYVKDSGNSGYVSISNPLSTSEIVELTKTALLMLAVEDSRALTDEGLVNAFLEKLIHNAAQYKEAGHTPPINAVYAKEVYQQVKDSHAKQGASA